MRLLLIDDDHRLYELLERFLGGHGVQVDHAPDGPEGLEAVDDGHDAVLLDIMMPSMSGLDVLRKIRERSEVPVIMLTARGDETDRVVGLELGADDYLAKPFSPRELLARVRAVMRRTKAATLQKEIRAGGLVLNANRREVMLNGERLDLTALEFDLLHALMQRSGRPVSRDAMLSLTGRDVVVSERTVDVHVSKLRKKLGEASGLIRTIRGVGYLLAPKEEG